MLLEEFCQLIGSDFEGFCCWIHRDISDN